MKPSTVITIAISLGCALVAQLLWYMVTTPSEGTVTSKKYDQPYTMTLCQLAGKVVICTPHYIPECYRIVYEKDDREGSSCVSSKEYDQYQPGDHFPNNHG